MKKAKPIAKKAKFVEPANTVMVSETVQTTTYKVKIPGGYTLHTDTRSMVSIYSCILNGELTIFPFRSLFTTSDWRVGGRRLIWGIFFGVEESITENLTYSSMCQLSKSVLLIELRTSALTLAFLDKLHDSDTSAA